MNALPRLLIAAVVLFAMAVVGSFGPDKDES